MIPSGSNLDVSIKFKHQTSKITPCPKLAPFILEGYFNAFLIWINLFRNHHCYSWKAMSLLRFLTCRRTLFLYFPYFLSLKPNSLLKKMTSYYHRYHLAKKKQITLNTPHVRMQRYLFSLFSKLKLFPFSCGQPHL